MEAEGAAAALQRLLARPPAASAIADRSGQYSLKAAADGVIAALDGLTT